MPSPNSFFPEFPLNWEMSVAEQFTLVGLLERTRPEVAIEIGTHFGGSLQVLDKFCGRVHSIDVDPEVRAQLASRFERVCFHTGSSRELIPRVLSEIEQGGGKLGFILVDGDHTAAGVQADIEVLLRHRPKGPLNIVLHDSFNPDCRAGMRRAAWGGSPYVHAVDLDFVTGTFHATATGGAFARSMWGGFALAVLHPEPRIGPLQVRESQASMQQLVFRHSAHRLWHKVLRAVRQRLSR